MAVAMDQATAVSLPSAPSLRKADACEWPLQRARALFGFSCFGFSHLGANSMAVNLSSWASIRDLACSKRSASILQLMFGVMMSSRCARSATSARISASRSFSKAVRALLLGASLRLAGVLLYTAEEIGCLIHQIESCCGRVA